MTTFTEILPARKSSKRSAVNFTPTDNNEYCPVAGLLTIHTDRATCSYTVVEFPTGWRGRGFTLAKVTEGTDAEAESYSVFCDPARLGMSCDCKGHERFGHCKHADAIRAIVANGWL